VDADAEALNNMIPACKSCAHAVKRVEHLFNEASRLGLDYPTDQMLEDMVRDAEWNALWNPREIAAQHDQDMREMRRIWNMALGANVVEESELISERDWSQHLRIQLAAEVEKMNKLQQELAAEREISAELAEQVHRLKNG